MEPQGLYHKYTIIKNRTGEEVKRPSFVLLPENDPHARAALRAYAASVEAENAALAADLRSWMDSIEPETSFAEQLLTLDLEVLVERMDIPCVYEEQRARLGEMIVSALRAPKRDGEGSITAHVCNEVMKNFTPKFAIGYSYEDRNLESTEAAHAFAEYVNQLVPGVFVLVDTGDYLMPHCGENRTGYHRVEKVDCETYDPHYWLYLVPRDEWERQRVDVERAVAEWRAEHMKCKVTGEPIETQDHHI